MRVSSAGALVVIVRRVRSGFALMFLFGSVALSSGCASIGSGDDGFVTRPLERSAPPDSAARVDIEGWAAKFRTPKACEAEARLYMLRQAPDAFKRLLACGRRPDFDVLEPLLREPWLPVIKLAKQTGLKLLVRTMARRGELADDVGSCQAAGVEIALLDPEGPVRVDAPGYVVAAGMVEEVGPTPALVQLSYQMPGYSRRAMGSRYTTITRYRYDGWGRLRGTRRTYRYSRGVRSRTLQAWYVTERRLKLARGHRCASRPGQTRVLFGRITRYEPPRGGEPRDTGWMSLLGCYPIDVEVRRLEEE